MKPNAIHYDPRSEYLAELIRSTGLTQAALGELIDVDPRTIRRWITGGRQFNYRDQFAIESLVREP